jgi:hypothetical protein
MSMRAPLVVLIALALLYLAAPVSLAQAPPAQSQEQPAQTQEQPAPTQEPPAQETVTAPFDPAWRSSSTGRQIPDPTGTRFFRPAVSGGTGVVAW